MKNDLNAALVVLHILLWAQSAVLHVVKQLFSDNTLFRTIASILKKPTALLIKQHH
ncbi:hypothetical protein N483_14545 [Pseudoalteromonas luteoviolacea NCIMB 1944]|nr:hypothetical protein N483_14545 [Pseudoalteromonas luteoviolacea NCIMB 1944]